MAPAPHPLQVVVLGGGPAAVTTATTLREVARDHVHLSIVAPNPEADSLRGRARALRAELYGGRAVRVDARRHEVLLHDGRRIPYDVVVVAIGARTRVAYSRARTFFGQAGAVALSRLLADLQDGHIPSLAFVVPPGATWSLPLYELAIQAGTEARAAGLDVPMRFLTAERRPLELFGDAASDAVGRMLDDAGVTFRGTTPVSELPGGVLREGRVGARFVRERTIALPVVEGLALPGVPATFDGFVPVDGHGAVRGMVDVFAAGAATNYAIKQRDLAVQQATVVAAAVAERAGAPVTSEPWVPRVRGHLLAGGGRSLVLERDGDAPTADRALRWEATPSPRAAAGGRCTSR
jgi:sulfide:quinone oxidoreductase